jgi:hypothetical protein
MNETGRLLNNKTFKTWLRFQSQSQIAFSRFQSRQKNYKEVSQEV